MLRNMLFNNGFTELILKGEQVLNTLKLPDMHQNPCGRVLVSQARVENYSLITAASTIIDSASGYVTMVKN
ncbi:hypothetical protein B4900_10715 [Yersinia rohdei]|nr:hypothetical protein B4900_10715 [Yersinia rohdei]